MPRLSFARLLAGNWNQAQTVNVNVSMDGGALARPMYDASGNATGQTGVVEPTSAAYFGPPSVFIDAVASSSDDNFGGGPRCAMPRRDRRCSSRMLPSTNVPLPLFPAYGGVYSVRLADTRAPLGDTMQNPIVVTQLPYSAAFRIEEWPYNVDVSSACQSSSFKGGADAYFAFK